MLYKPVPRNSYDSNDDVEDGMRQNIHQESERRMNAYEKQLEEIQKEMRDSRRDSNLRDFDPVKAIHDMKNSIDFDQNETEK